MNTNTSQSRKPLACPLKRGILVDMTYMMRSYKADNPQITLLLMQFPLTITIICQFKTGLISDYFEKLDLKPTPSPNGLLMFLSSLHLECITKRQIITKQAILSRMHHSKNDQTLADMVKGKLIHVALFSIFQKFEKTHLSTA